MSGMPRKFALAIRRFGRAVSIGSKDTFAVEVPVGGSSVADLFSAEDWDALPKPVRLVYLASHVPVEVGQAYELGGVAATVRRVVDVRFRGQSIVRIAVVA